MFEIGYFKNTIRFLIFFLNFRPANIRGYEWIVLSLSGEEE